LDRELHPCLHPDGSSGESWRTGRARSTRAVLRAARTARDPAAESSLIAAVLARFSWVRSRGRRDRVGTDSGGRLLRSRAHVLEDFVSRLARVASRRSRRFDPAQSGEPRPLSARISAPSCDRRNSNRAANVQCARMSVPRSCEAFSSAVSSLPRFAVLS
jgi:hypothetical protein